MTTTNNPLAGNIRGKDSGNWEGGHVAETARETVIRHILSEREHQIAKWGNPQHDHAWWYVIMGEEVGEVANALQEVEDQKSADIAEQLQAMSAEIVQVAAVATAWGSRCYACSCKRGCCLERETNSSVLAAPLPTVGSGSGSTLILTIMSWATTEMSRRRS